MSKAYIFLAAAFLALSLLAYALGGAERAGQFALLMVCLGLPLILWGLGSLQGSLDRIEEKLGTTPHPEEEDPDADLKDDE